jgi:hypothetical protein
VADANSAEASIAWSNAGQSGGALLFSASNANGAGKAYIFQYDGTGLDYGGATSVRLTFDLKVSTPLVGAALHLQTNIPGPGVVNTFDIQNQGLNAASWTSYSFDFSGVTSGATTFSMHLNMASGAFIGSGGAILIDNVRLAGLGGGGELSQVGLPITFDADDVDYTMVDFGGVMTTLVADPTNAANTVARTVKPDTAELWGGTTTSTDELGLAAPIPFTAQATKMTLRVYSPDVGVPVRLKVEDKDDDTRTCETEAVTTVANGWETLEFDFAAPVTATAALNFGYTYDKASIFFNFGTTGAEAGTKTYLWDDLAFGGSGSGVMGCTDPTAVNYNPAATVDDGSCMAAGAAVVELTFDDASGIAGWTRVADANSAEASIAWSDAGVSGGAIRFSASNANGAGKAYIFQYDATGLSYGGATGVRLTFDVKVATPLVGAALHLQTNIPGTGVTNNFDIQNQGLNAATWTSYSFDFAGVDPTGTTFSMHLNMASGAFIGSGGAILVDNVRLEGLGGGGDGDQVSLPITFDDADVDYTVTDFGGTTTTIVADPTNASNRVASTLKGAAAEFWAGTTSSKPAGLAMAIPITASATTMSVRVYSPDVGIPVRLKIETAGDPTRSVETEAVTTVANQWQTLVFNFANEVSGTAEVNPAYTYNMASIFFNFGTAGAVAGPKTYLWDDVRFGTN